jgi:hypothetical protein
MKADELMVKRPPHRTLRTQPDQRLGERPQTDFTRDYDYSQDQPGAFPEIVIFWSLFIVCESHELRHCLP